MRGAVLAGGAASRYGGVPKGLLAVGGRRILDRVVDSVHAVTGAQPLLIANAPGASTWRPDLKTIPDARPGLGSLGGIYTAVTAVPEPVLCVAWDMPFVPQALLRALIEGATGAGGGGPGVTTRFFPRAPAGAGWSPWARGTARRGVPGSDGGSQPPARGPFS